MRKPVWQQLLSKSPAPRPAKRPPVPVDNLTGKRAIKTAFTANEKFPVVTTNQTEFAKNLEKIQ